MATTKKCAGCGGDDLELRAVSRWNGDAWVTAAEPVVWCNDCDGEPQDVIEYNRRVCRVYEHRILKWPYMNRLLRDDPGYDFRLTDVEQEALYNLQRRRAGRWFLLEQDGGYGKCEATGREGDLIRAIFVTEPMMTDDIGVAA